MPTTVMTQEIATPTSDHIAPGPLPAISNTPPLPPGPGPVPAPFAYIARSATAEQTKKNLMVGGDEVLVVESDMKIEQPGNVASQPVRPAFPADILTQVVNAKASIISGFPRVTVGDKQVAATTSQVCMNVPTPESKIAQLLSTLMAGMAVRAAVAAGRRPHAHLVGMVDPVSAASGEVFDDDNDLTIAGAWPVIWSRSYSSSRAGEPTPLGKSGWTHAFHQWIDVAGDRLTLRDQDGTDVVMAAPAAGGATFHRGLRIEVRRKAEDVFEVYHLETRRTRRFEPLARGERAVLRSYRNARDVRVELVYLAGRLVKVTSPSGRELRFSYDDTGRITRAEVWARGGPWTAAHYKYDAEGDLVQVTGAAGDVWRYAYDGAHRLVQKTLPTGLSFHYRYDDTTGRCIHAFGDGGLHEGRFEYDAAKGTTVMTGNPGARSYQWDSRGVVTAMRALDGSRFEEVEYDADLHITRVTDEHGEAFKREVDERDNVTHIMDGDGRELLFFYRDDLLVRRVEPGGLVTELAYDRFGDLSSLKYPSGNTVTIEYDGAGRIVSVHGPDGLLGAFTYDEEGNVATETGPGGDVWRYTYDALGRVTKRTDPRGGSMLYEHDAADRVVAVTYPDGGNVRYTYDALGRVTSEEGPGLRSLRRRHEGIQSTTQHILDDGTEWTCSYDRVEQPRAIKNPLGDTWEMYYDRAGRIVEERRFDGATLRYRYGPSDHVARVDRSDGTWRSRVTDRRGAMLAERSSHGAIHYERDGAGRVTAAVVDEAPGKVTVTFDYDALGRLVAETQEGLTLRYEYDARGRVVSRTLPTGQTTRFHYSVADRIARIEHGGRALLLTYDITGNELRRTFEPAGVDILTEVDSMDRPARRLVLGPPGQKGQRPVLVERTMEYDGARRPVSVVDSLRGRVTFEHDAAGRLTGARRSALHERYSYDVAGSVVGATFSGTLPPSPWSTRPGNVLVQAGDLDFDNDALHRRSRRTSRAHGSAVDRTDYLWDCRDRLREVRFADGRRVVYTYDAFGRRLRKDFYDRLDPASPGTAAPSRTVRYLWQGNSLAAELDSLHGDRVFVIGPGSFLPLMQEQAGEVFAYVCDPVGTPLELIDERGAVAWQSNLSVWGAPLPSAKSATSPRREGSTPVSTPFRLLGQYADEETGLSYVRYRYFDPETAHWLSADPMGLDGGVNLFSFNGSPVMHTDPIGLRCMIGNPLVDKPFKFIAAVPAKDGYYDVVVHGDPHEVGEVGPDGSWKAMDINELKAKVLSSPDYTPGMKIRLISCETGQSPGGFAQQFANKMGVTVEAPSGLVSPSNGALSIHNKVVDPVTGATTWHPGSWGTFVPQPATIPSPPSPPPAATTTQPMPAVRP